MKRSKGILFSAKRDAGHAGRRRRPLALFLLLTLLQTFAPPSPRARAQASLSLSEPLHTRWLFPTEQTSNLTPAVSTGDIFLPLAGGEVVSLRAADGNLNWRAEMGGDISSDPLADDGAVYVATETGAPAGGASTGGAPNAGAAPRASGTLRALSRQNGVTLWMRTLQAPLRGALSASQTTLFGGAADGRVYAFDKRTGASVWVSSHTAAFLSRPSPGGGRLFIGAEDGTLLALDITNGKPLWRYRTRGPLRAAIAQAQGLVFAGSADGSCYALEEATGRLRWRARAGAAVQSVVPTARGLLVVSLDNFVYLLSFRKGERAWKRQLAGRTAAPPLVLDDCALLAPLAGDECVVLGLADGKKVNSLPVGEDNNTAASPVLSGELLLVTTRRGLLAFADAGGLKPGVEARP